MSQAIAHQSLEPESLAQVKRGLKFGLSEVVTEESGPTGQHVRQMKRRLAAVSSASGGSKWQQAQLPRGIPGRVALSLLPNPPWWLRQRVCIANHDVYSRSSCGHQCF